MEITEEIAEILINQERIFKENFIKLLRLYIKRADDEKRQRAEDLVNDINNLFCNEDKGICLFVLAYLIGRSFTMEEYEKIDKFIGNNYMNREI